MISKNHFIDQEACAFASSCPDGQMKKPSSRRTDSKENKSVLIFSCSRVDGGNIMECKENCLVQVAVCFWDCFQSVLKCGSDFTMMPDIDSLVSCLFHFSFIECLHSLFT